MDQMPQANPSQMLPPSLLRGGQTSPGQIFQQNPLATGMSPSAMGQQPGLQPPPPAGSQAVNQSMPPGTPPIQPTAQPNAGVPGQDPQQMSEAMYILQALDHRLRSHSKITQSTVSTLQKMIEAGLPVPGQDQSQITA